MGIRKASKEAPPSKEELELFYKLLDENRFDFVALAYIIFPFGEKDHELEQEDLYPWQIEELIKLSEHLKNPETRFTTYKRAFSTGNGAAKTTLIAIMIICLMYTQRVRGRITANNEVQLHDVIWAEYGIWFNRARYIDEFFDQYGTGMYAKNPKVAKSWRLDTFVWDEKRPAAVSGLHNKGGAVIYVFEEGPGIPEKIWTYAGGAFTEKNTIKLHLTAGNSDEPDTYFERIFNDPKLGWSSRRIDCRTLPHTDKEEIRLLLIACGGDEDHDDFRRRVRGLPRKSSSEAIISYDLVKDALDKGLKFDPESVKHMPCILSCDPAWRDGDHISIWYRQGPYMKMLEFYKLPSIHDHRYTYAKLCHWERVVKADVVFIDRGEGTALYGMAQAEEKYNWELVEFSGNPYDDVPRESLYANLRAQMHWELLDALIKGGVLASRKAEWIPTIQQQLTVTKGLRRALTDKKLAEPKDDIRQRIKCSPDANDGCILLYARPVTEKTYQPGDTVGNQPIKMAKEPSPYARMNPHQEQGPLDMELFDEFVLTDPEAPIKY